MCVPTVTSATEACAMATPAASSAMPAMAMAGSCRKPATRSGLRQGAFEKVEAVLAPEQLAVQFEGRRAENLNRSEEHTSELQSLMRISYAVFCLKKNKKNNSIQQQNKDTNIR